VADQAEANGAGRPELTQDQQEQLARLRWLWEDYRIGCDGETWSAAPWVALDEVITAGTQRELWDEVKADHARRDWPPRTGYWVERCSGPPYWVELPSGGPGRLRGS
jgi:hypothetical protein